MYFSLLICWCLSLVYTYVVFRRWWAWLQMPAVITSKKAPVTLVSVLIPVRNEADRILDLLSDLEKQTYSKSNFEVLIIDDSSEDNTAELVENFKKNTDLSLRLIYLQDSPGLRLKKAAISTAVTLAKGELLVQTDGDCRVTPDWLFTLTQYHEQTNAVCLSGPVCLLDDKSLFTRMQVVEFASLIGIGGGSMALGKPNMCNGANLAYVRQAFIAVQGFTGNEHVASGDDEFLMHKLAKQYPGRVLFLKSRTSIVYTPAQKTVKSFINQRVRWASKWPNYTAWNIKLLAVLVFAVNLGLFWVLLNGILGQISLTQTLALYFFKFVVDGLFLLTILRFLGRGRYIFYQIPLQLIYIPYVLYTALRGLSGTYYWKGRQVKNK